MPQIGIGYRPAIGDWFLAHLDRFDVLEITVDHFLHGGTATRAGIEAVARHKPVVLHGVGLSIGTDVAVDLSYVREVAAVARRLGAPSYSEHLAFTRVPGCDLANLLPLPRTRAVADAVIGRIREVRHVLGLPFSVENITYLFDWPDSELDDAAFLNLVCDGTGASILLDVENLYVNSHNHGFDPYAFLDALKLGSVSGIHTAGGGLVDGVLVDTHDHPVPDGALDLLDYVLTCQQPDTIVLERDDRLHQHEQLLADVERIRRRVATSSSVRRSQTAAPPPRRQQLDGAPPRNVPLIRRQTALVEHLTNPARFAAPELEAAPTPELACFASERLRLLGELSLAKRRDKVAAVLPVTIEHLDAPFEHLFREFAAAVPPLGIGRYENAVQFIGFLNATWHTDPPAKPYLRDIAAVELAIARARRHVGEPEPADRPPDPASVRRNPGASFLEIGYDVRPLFAGGCTPAAGPARRPACLLVAPSPGDGSARIFQVPESVYRTLEHADTWGPVEGKPDLGNMVRTFVNMGVLEPAP